MARFVNGDGVVVTVSDDLVLGSEWTPADEKAPAKKAPAKATEK